MTQPDPILLDHAHRMIRITSAIHWVDRMLPAQTAYAADLQDRELPYKKLLKKAQELRDLRHKGIRYLIIQNAADLYYNKPSKDKAVVYLPTIKGTRHIDMHMDSALLLDLPDWGLYKDKQNAARITQIALWDRKMHRHCRSLKVAIKTLKHLYTQTEGDGQ